MDFATSERAVIRPLDSKLSADRASRMKSKLREALNLLDDYAKTGSDTFLKLAMQAHQDVVDAIGSRAPEQVEEKPR